MPEKRTALVYSFSPSNYGISLSDADIQSYYEKNKAQFIAEPAKVQVRRILFKTESSDEIEALKEKVSRIQHELVEDPHSFAQVAKEVSQDSDSVSKGGLLEPFAKGTHDPVFERAAFILKDDGAISGVISTKDGLEIVQRVSKRAQQYKPFYLCRTRL